MCSAMKLDEQVVEKLSAIAAVHASVEHVLDTEAEPCVTALWTVAWWR